MLHGSMTVPCQPQDGPSRAGKHRLGAV